MSTGEGGSGESRSDQARSTRRAASLERTFRRMLAGTSAGIAAMRTTARSRSVAAWVEAHVPPAWRRPRRLILAGAVLLAAVVLIIATRPVTPRHPAPGTTVFPVGDRVVLRFAHSTGSVHVRAGPGGQVSITEHRNGVTDAIHTSYRQRGDVIAVAVSVGTNLAVATWVDFDVAVPEGTNASVAVPAGTLDASGLRGILALHDSNGSISATGVSGAMALQTTSGSISMRNVTGQVSATTDNGTITTASTRLGGHSLLRAQSGTINFHGRLDSGCHAVLRNTNGAIGVTLPGDSPAVVDARSPLGAISSEFPSVHITSDGNGRVAAGRIGQGTPARLSIQTMSGSIDLNRGK